MYTKTRYCQPIVMLNDLRSCINPLNAELNPICHLLALLGGATIVVIGRLRIFLISSFRRVLYVVCFLLGNYPPGNYPKESIQG